MKSILLISSLIFTLSAQELSMTVDLLTPRGAQTTTSYFGEDFAYMKSFQREVLFLTKTNTIYTVDNTKKELKKLNQESALMQVQQMTMMMGKLKLKSTGKTKEIKGFKAKEYKVSNENGMAMLTGTLYTAEIPLMQEKKFAAIIDFQKKMNPFTSALENPNATILKSELNIETGQGMPMSIESILSKYETSLSKETKDLAAKISKYTIVEEKAAAAKN